MSEQISGNIKGLAAKEIKDLERLYRRRLSRNELVSIDLAREIYDLSERLSRKVGVLVSRDGHVLEVFLGSKSLVYIPDLGRYRLGQGRLRRLRLIVADLSGSAEPTLSQDLFTDLEKLRLDAVIAVKPASGRMQARFAHIVPLSSKEQSTMSTHSEVITDLGRFDFEFEEFIEALESELERETQRQQSTGKTGAILVSVSDRTALEAQSSLDELAELARTAGIQIVDRVTQRRKPDPKTLLGQGKLEEVVLLCLRRGAELIIFDTELRPSQWRSITNSTDLKVIDRSMLILDIFAQRAMSSEGRLQVELAQLKYNMPKLVEKDAGLSRLSGGIGGRGPGETKLEVGRRTIRDRITQLEREVQALSKQRALRRVQRSEKNFPVVAILGYTNVGKSTLFNALTNSTVVVENKLFATLDPAHRRLRFPHRDNPRLDRNHPVILTDTVGFIRDLPEELISAFKATLEVLNEAVLFIHVLDASDPQVEEQKAAVDRILSEMGLSQIPTIVVLNKIDRLAPEMLQPLLREYRGVGVSALSGLGLESLLARIERDLYSERGAVKSSQRESKAQKDADCYNATEQQE